MIIDDKNGAQCNVFINNHNSIAPLSISLEMPHKNTLVTLTKTLEKSFKTDFAGER